MNALEQITSQGNKALFFKTDVSDEASVTGMVEKVLSTYGRLDGAFNNAGIGQSHKVLHEISRKEWQRVIDVDLTGVFLCMKYEIEAMLKHGGGSIANT
jgi:NAD(P)-dependent dehydrogenase (short-subunit alcohol dehydrogenase family)